MPREERGEAACYALRRQAAYAPVATGGHILASGAVYVGLHVFNRTDSKTFTKKDESEWVKVPVPAIIEQELFDKASKLRDRLTPFKCAARRETSPNLLTGLLKCDCCNSTMVLTIGISKGRSYRYYKRSSRINKGNGACPSKAYPMNWMDSLVLDTFRERIYTPEYFRAVIETYRKHANRHRSDGRLRTKKLEAELKEIEPAETKLFESVEKGILEVDDRFKDRVRQHKMRREAVIAELDTLQRTQQNPMQAMTPQKIEVVARTLKRRFGVSTLYSRAYLKATVSEIRIANDGMVLRGENKAIANLVAANGDISPETEVSGFIPSWRARADETGTFPLYFWLRGSYSAALPQGRRSHVDISVYINAYSVVKYSIPASNMVDN